MISFSFITPNELIDITEQVSGNFYAPDKDNLVEQINDAIFQAVGVTKTFSVSIAVRGLLPGTKAPPEIFALHQEYRGRGFFTRYNVVDDEGTFTVSWSNPDFNIYNIQTRPYWNETLLDELGTGAKAYEYYLAMTNGNDLRRFTPNIVIRDIHQKLIKAALQDKTMINYYGPENIFTSVIEACGDGDGLVAIQTLGNLFEESADYLREAGYAVVDTAYPWVINAPAPEPDPEPPN